MGLTTAATIWAVAGIGIAVGSGHLVVATAATAVILVCLTALRPLESWTLRRTRHVRLQLVVTSREAVPKVLALLSEQEVRVEDVTIERRGLALELEVSCNAPRETMRSTIDMLLALTEIESVTIDEV